VWLSGFALDWLQLEARNLVMESAFEKHAAEQRAIEERRAKQLAHAQHRSIAAKKHTV
jgi:hypothetical protein